jgi:hypothetical protein
MKTALGLLMLISIAFSVTSCFKEDEKVTPHVPGDAMIDTIELTGYYKNQVYYDLGTKTPVQVSLRNKWDLSFECAPNGWHIRLNTSCFMYAADLGNTGIGLPADTTGVPWKFDVSNGKADSTAIGVWFTINGSDTISNGHTYAINRGLDELGNPRGMRQLVIDSIASDVFYFRVSDFNGGNQKSYSVAKNPTVSNILFTFDSGTGVASEPDKNNWDLVFTQYTTLLYTDEGTPYPYLVTGVLMNPNLVIAAMDSLTAFTDVNYELINNFSFSNNQDQIGYDWKYYSFDSGSYTIRPQMIYIIRDTEGFYYKLHFLGFYNDKGEKGYPTIEFQKL